MKQYILITFLFVCNVTFGQSINISITDSETTDPLPYANIYFKNSGIGLSTDLNGAAILQESKVLDKDSIIISYIGYEEQIIYYSKENSRAILIKLEPATNLLSAVTITYIKPPSPKNIIKKALRKTSSNYSSQPVILTALYRETIKENDDYIQLNEAIVKTHYTEYPQKKLDRKIWQDWYYDETYSFDIEGSLNFYPLLKDFNTKRDLQTIGASRISDNLSKHDIETTLNGDPLLLYAFDKIKYQYDFLNLRLLRKYQFKHETEQVINGEECYVISFYPKTLNRRFRIDQSRKNKSPIYIGRMYISKDTYAVLNFQYKLAVERDFGFFEKSMPLDYQVEVNYKKIESMYAIDYIKFTQTKSLGTDRDDNAILQTADQEIHVLDMETENVISFPDSIIFKSTRYSALRYYRENYDPKFWNSLELPDKLQLDKKLITNLEKERPLSEQFESYSKIEKVAMPEPLPIKRPYTFSYHSHNVIDSLHWMALPQNQSSLKKYLSEENKYAKNALVEDRDYQKKIFNRLNTFYKEPEAENIIRNPGEYYFDSDSLDNSILYFQKDTSVRVQVVNTSSFIERKGDIYINQITSNQSNNTVLIKYEKVGKIGDIVTVWNFEKNTEIDSLRNVYTIEWYSDTEYFYTKTNSSGSARSLHFRDSNTGKDTTIYTEIDLKFDVEVIKKGSNLFCTIQSKTENEIFFIKSKNDFPSLELIKKRKEGVMNKVRTNDKIYLLVNDEKSGSRIEAISFSGHGNVELIAGEEEGYIIDILPLDNKIISLSYKDAEPKLKQLNYGDKSWHLLKTNLGIGQYELLPKTDDGNYVQFTFSCPSKPFARYKYDFDTELMDTTFYSYPRKNYHENTTTKLMWAISHDGIKVPITLVKNRSETIENRGLILKVYGAYGAITTPSFSSQDAILLNEGYMIAYAHVRGESILGTSWYKRGRVMHKKNSILDYIACAEHLTKMKHLNLAGLYGYGNSAGGLVVAQAVNIKPQLFDAIILDHPYLDVVNTMMNDTLPLTIDEYKEWGDPKNKDIYEYILDYSPYQNVRNQSYPNILVHGSFYDYQTPIWQIAKYVAKLRENNNANSEIILFTDMNSGHSGSTTGKEWIVRFLT